MNDHGAKPRLGHGIGHRRGRPAVGNRVADEHDRAFLVSAGHRLMIRTGPLESKRPFDGRAGHFYNPAMPALSYESAGVDYGPLDAFKRACQGAAATTVDALAGHGMAEPAGVRGESAYLIETPTEYLAHVEEGLGTKNLIADAVLAASGRSFYTNIGVDTVATIVNDMVTVGALRFRSPCTRQPATRPGSRGARRRPIWPAGSPTGAGWPGPSGRRRDADAAGHGRPRHGRAGRVGFGANRAQAPPYCRRRGGRRRGRAAGQQRRAHERAHALPAPGRSTAGRVRHAGRRRADLRRGAARPVGDLRQLCPRLPAGRRAAALRGPRDRPRVAEADAAGRAVRVRDGRAAAPAGGRVRLRRPGRAILLGYLFNFVRLCTLVLYYIVALHFTRLQPHGEVADYIIGGCLFLFATWLLIFIVSHSQNFTRPPELTSKPGPDRGASATRPPHRNSPGSAGRRSNLLPQLAALTLLIVVSAVSLHRAWAASARSAPQDPSVLGAFPQHIGPYKLARSWNEYATGGPVVFQWADYSPADPAQPHIALGISPVLGSHDTLICHSARGEDPIWHAELPLATAAGTTSFSASFFNDGVTQYLETTTLCQGSSCGEYSDNRRHLGFVYSRPSTATLFGHDPSRPIPVMLRAETLDTALPAELARQQLTTATRTFVAALDLQTLLRPYQH